MTRHTPSPADIAKVESDLWNVVRALELIEREAVEVAMLGQGKINEKAEGIAGVAAIAIASIRQHQILLGGAA